MDDAAATDIMARFGRAFFRRDREALGAILTEDAEWHFAVGDTPDGRVHLGVDGFLQGIAANEALFESLRFEDVVCSALGSDRIVMTYRLSGRWRDGAAVDQRGIEIITLEDGRIARKDVFWKQRAAG